MERSFDRLGSSGFDLLVVGGGIYGVWVAYDAALRGLSVALVEKHDWASATSSASSKLLHGGLRYLEYGRLRMVRRSLVERRRLSRLAPHSVRPLRFLFPVYAGDRVGRTRLRWGLRLYDRLAGSGQPVDRHRALRRKRLLEQYEFISPTGLKGGFTFGDCQTDDARFVVEILDGAVREGTVAANRAEAVEPLIDGGRVVGAVVQDRETGETVEVSARVTVDCAGPWSGRLAKQAGGGDPAPRLTKGVHLVMPPLPTEDAILIPSRGDRRVVFLIPWYGRTLLGTTDTDYDGDPKAPHVESDDVSYLLERANRVLRDAPWSPSNVISSFAGIRTLPGIGRRAPSALSREWKLVQPVEGLLGSIGGKFTSARRDAAITVDRALGALGRGPSLSPTEDRPFPWCPEPPHSRWGREVLRQGLALGLDEETIEGCQSRYGTRIEGVFERIEEAPDLARRILPGAPFCLAEIVHVVNEEMVRTLEDVVRRRLPLTLLFQLSERNLNEIATLVGGLLGWSESRVREETRYVLSESAPTPAAHEPV